MKHRFVIFLALMIFGLSPIYPFNSGLRRVDGETIYEKQFVEDYEKARVQLEEKSSLDPMLSLVKKYTGPTEIAELELTVGLAYNQRTGLVNPEKAIQHLTNAAHFDLPERTVLDIMMWRGSSYEQLKQYKQALDDYLRGLVICSYYDWSRKWPEIEKPSHPVYANSSDPENEIRTRDYNAYRYRNDFIRHVIMQKYFLIDSVKRIQKVGSIDDEKLNEALKQITPDGYIVDKIRKSLGEKNTRPWP